MPCDCRVVENGSRSEPWRIVYCPTHEAAEDMREALAAYVDAYREPERLRENSAAMLHLRRAIGLLARIDA